MRAHSFKMVNPNEFDEEEERTPLPMTKIAVLAFAWFSFTFQINALWVIAPFFVDDLGTTEYPEKIGFYCGLWSVAFYGGQLLSSFVWRSISGRFGKKATVLLGLFGLGFSITWLGFAFSYEAAIIARFFGGVLNGLVEGIHGVMVNITDATNQRRAFDFFAMGFGFGAVLGPAAAALLARPARMGLFSQSTLFQDFPYSLVCMVCGGMCFLAFVAVAVVLSAAEAEGTGTPAAESIDTGEDRPRILIYHTRERKERNRKNKVSLWQLMQDPKIMRSVLSFAILRLAIVIVDEAFPLYCRERDAMGGLGWDPRKIGGALSAGGLFLVFFQLIWYPRLSGRLGAVWVCRFATAGLGAYCLLVPTSRYVNQKDQNSAFFFVAVLQCIRHFAAYGGLKSMNQIMNNAVNKASSRERIIALGATLASISEVVGPLVMGLAWQWANGPGLGSSWRLHMWVVFAVPCLLALLDAAAAAALPPELDTSLEYRSYRQRHRDSSAQRQPITDEYVEYGYK